MGNFVEQNHKIMAIYPPGTEFQRGEDRCQISIADSMANSNRACNDLGYVAALLKHSGYSVFLRDYQVENLSVDDMFQDIKKQKPDMIFISTTTGSVTDDINIINKIKEKYPDIISILKGAIFFNPEIKLFELLDLNNIDYLIGGEVEFIIENLVNAHYKNKEALKDIEGISYKINGKWIINNLKTFHDDMDSLPFPDRSLMKNDLYINLETNKPMALITTAKGCCFSCSYCLSNIISGRKVRERSPENIIGEIEDCIKNYNITDFFFKSDTFTANREKVIKLCNLIIQKGLNKKINWVATARSNSIDDEMLSVMKESGCSLLAIGFESGSDESLKMMKKGTTVEQNIEAAKLCKKHGIKILGYFLIGFPWEDETHLEETKKHIFETDADYIEISVVVPYYRTQIYEEYVGEKSELSDIIGSDSYNNIYKKYAKLNPELLQNYRKDILFKYYTRPGYICKKLSEAKSLSVVFNYIKYGLRMLKNTLLR